MAGPWQQILKSAQDEWPKALIGLLVPATQFAWSYCNGRRGKKRQSDLRKKISELDQFLHSTLPNTLEGQRIRSDAQAEYDKDVAELFLLSHAQPVESHRLPVPAYTEETGAAQRPTQATIVPESASRLRSILRFYAPTSIKGWIVQSFYFLFLAISLLVGLAAMTDFSDFGVMATVFAFYAAITFGFWYWSGRVLSVQMFGSADRKASGKSAWLPITLIAISAIMECCVIMACTLGDQNQFSLDTIKANWGGLLGCSVFFGAVIVLCTLWKRRIRSRAVTPSIAGLP